MEFAKKHNLAFLEVSCFRVSIVRSVPRSLSWLLTSRKGWLINRPIKSRFCLPQGAPPRPPARGAGRGAGRGVGRRAVWFCCIVFFFFLEGWFLFYSLRNRFFFFENERVVLLLACDVSLGGHGADIWSTCTAVYASRTLYYLFPRESRAASYYVHT